METLSWPLKNTMHEAHGHKTNDVFAPQGAWQSDASASKKCLEYDPFGSLMPGRNYSTPSYSFGFQGQLKDQEIYGEGNSYAFDFRMHDPRVGRFWSIDPLAAKYAYNSPYAFSENRVTDMVELEGLETAPAITGDEHEGQSASTTTDSYARGGVHTVQTWNWMFHEGGVDGSDAGWMLDDSYAENVIKPLAKDYVAWQDGNSDGDMWAGFASNRSNSGELNWGAVIADAAAYQRANPTYDGWKSYIPIWGPANQAYLDFSVGKYGWGTFNSAMAISDIFLFKALVQQPIRVGLESGMNGLERYYGIGMSNSWGATKSRWARLGIDELSGGSKHHWLLSQQWMGDSQWRRALGNQGWNIYKFDNHFLHMELGHGSLLSRAWSSPLWFRGGLISGGARTGQFGLRQ